MSDVLTFAEEFFDAVARGDIDTVSACYRDDVTVWHNWDDNDQTKAENLETLAGISVRYDSFEYADARMTELADGFLRQHVIVATRDGKTARVPAILRVYVEGRRVHRIEEYFDHGQLSAALT